MSATGSSHTVVLVQFEKDENSRPYLDFDTIQEALDGICKVYEQKLKFSNKCFIEFSYKLFCKCSLAGVEKASFKGPIILVF